MSLKHLLNQTLTQYSGGSYGADGKPTYGTGSSVACRFENKVKRILLPTGQTLTIDAFAVVDGGASFATDDRVTYDSIDYKVVDVFKAVDDMGDTHHQELRLVKWPILA